MSEYFRKYIKKEHYPVHPYEQPPSTNLIDTPLHLRPHSAIVFMMHSKGDTGKRQMPNLNGTSIGPIDGG